MCEHVTHGRGGRRAPTPVHALLQFVARLCLDLQKYMTGKPGTSLERLPGGGVPQDMRVKEPAHPQVLLWIFILCGAILGETVPPKIRGKWQPRQRHGAAGPEAESARRSAVDIPGGQRGRPTLVRRRGPGLAGAGTGFPRATAARVSTLLVSGVGAGGVGVPRRGAVAARTVVCVQGTFFPLGRASDPCWDGSIEATAGPAVGVHASLPSVNLARGSRPRRGKDGTDSDQA